MDCTALTNLVRTNTYILTLKLLPLLKYMHLEFNVMHTRIDEWSGEWFDGEVVIFLEISGSVVHATCPREWCTGSGHIRGETLWMFGIHAQRAPGQLPNGGGVLVWANNTEWTQLGKSFL